jgi:hypothetical protein
MENVPNRHIGVNDISATQEIDDDDGFDRDDGDVADRAKEKSAARAAARRAAFRGDDLQKIANLIRREHRIEQNPEACARKAIEWLEEHAPGKTCVIRGCKRKITNIADLNERFCVLNIPGSQVLFASYADSVQISQPDLKLRTANEVVLVGFKDNGAPVWAESATHWTQHADRKTCGKIVFHAGEPDADVFNIWPGFGVMPAEGRCDLILLHVRDVIAAGDEKVNKAFLDLLAWQFQNVGRPSRIITVLFSEEQQTGKGIFAEQILARMWGRGGVVIKTKEHGLTRFNDNLQGVSCVIIDEANFSGDKQLADRIKGDSASVTATIEKKGMAAVTLPCALNFFQMTNHRHAAHVERGDVRYWLLPVSASRRNDPEYFSNLISEAENGGIAAFLDFLLKRDVTGFIPQRDVPRKNALLAENQIASLSHSDPLIWLRESLDDNGLRHVIIDRGNVDIPHKFPDGRDGSEQIPSARLIEGYRSWVRTLANNRATACGPDEFWRRLRDAGFSTLKSGGMRMRFIPDRASLSDAIDRLLSPQAQQDSERQ